MAQRMSKTVSAVYLVFLVIGSYVLLFSSIPLLYRVVIVAFSFILLLLLTLALQTVENIKPRAE
jgi:hypothetical protein